MAHRARVMPAATRRRRLLFHHLPLAVSTGLLVALFMTLPVFDVTAYRHGDIVSGPFPQAGAESTSTRAGGRNSGRSAPSRDQHDQTAHDATDVQRRGGHGGERPDASPPVARARHRRAHTETGHDGTGRRSVPAAESGSIARGEGIGDLGARTEADLARARTVQQLTVATGYLGVGLLGITLLLDPANLLLGWRNPVSSYLRRDVGIWAAVFGVLHVTLAVLIHVSHGSGVAATVLHFFIGENGAPLTNSFGLGNWTGLAALVIVVALLATSATPRCGGSRPDHGRQSNA